MTGQGKPCPDDETLLAFTEGQLEGPALDEVVKHLDACDECLSVVGGGSVRQPPSAPAAGALAITAASFAPGTRLAGRYTVGRFVARGGMGEVYEAADDLLGLRVALKTVLSTAAADRRAVELLRREVRVARSITHPGVCRVYDLGEHPLGNNDPRGERLLFLTMEFLDGITLGQRIRRQGPLPPALLLNIARQLASALAAAHAQGIVHRDFKSDNVMWITASEGPSPRVVIMDFGLARPFTASALTSTAGLVVGSAAYMAPEQVQGGRVDAAADVYAFGVVLFEAATGRLPFIGSTLMGTALKRLHEPPPSPRDLVPELHPAVDDLILRCLARQPADRPSSLNEVLAALADVDEDPGATQAVRTARVPRPARRLALGVAALAAAGVLAAVFYPRAKREPVAVERPAAPMPAVVAVPDAAPAGAVAEPMPPPLPAAEPPPAAGPGVAKSNRTRRLAKKDVPAVQQPPPPSGPKPESDRPEDPGRRSRSTYDGFADPFR